MLFQKMQLRRTKLFLQHALLSCYRRKINRFAESHRVDYITYILVPSRSAENSYFIDYKRVASYVECTACLPSRTVDIYLCKTRVALNLRICAGIATSLESSPLPFASGVFTLQYRDK